MAVYRKQTELDGAIRHELLGYVITDGVHHGNRHSHPFAEALYVYKGSFHLEYEDKSFSLSAGQAVVIRPHTEHLLIGEPDATLLYIGCSYIRSGTFALFPEQSMLEITDSAILEKLKTVAESFMNSDGSANIASSLLTPLDPFWRSLAEKNQIDQNEDILMERVKEYLTLHPYEQISVADISEKFYLSSHYLGNRFHKYVGMTIKQYHNNLRMEQALALIEGSNLPLSQIAEKLGFNTLQYFSNCFKAHFGVSPREIARNGTKGRSFRG